MIPEPLTRPEPNIGLVWPPHGGHIWLQVGAPAAATIEEELAREGLTINGIATGRNGNSRLAPPKAPPRRPTCPFEKGSYMWERWIEDRDQLEAAHDVAEEFRLRGRIGDKLRVRAT